METVSEPVPSTGTSLPTLERGPAGAAGPRPGVAPPATPSPATITLGGTGPQNRNVPPGDPESDLRSPATLAPDRPRRDPARGSLQGGNKNGERAGDRAARSIATAAGATSLVALAGVGLFLLIRGLPALRARQGELPDDAANFFSLAGPLAFGSVWAAALALLFAVPVAVAAALFMTMYAPRRLAGLLGAIIDLLAAIPSVVYGLWGLMVFAPMTAGLYRWLSSHFGWFPLFAGQPSATGRTMLTASLVLAIMVLPIIASVCREVFLQTPTLSIEAALALGATKWEMIRLAVFPFARSGIVSGAMLGLGRALGETMVMAMVLSPTPFLISLGLTTSTNPNTIAAFIAQSFPEAYGMEVNALIGLGLILFAITFAVNWLARRMVARSKPGA